MAEEHKKPLLERAYHANCPGCAVDRKKQANPSYPYKEFLYVWLITLCVALPIQSLFPFLYFMIRDLHVAERVEDIGFYAGFVGASYMLGRTLTSVAWGMIADRYGRKPVIIFGIISTIVFNTLFGLSTNYSMAIASRLCLGIFNGLLGPIRAYSVEVCRPEHKAVGLSIVSTSWGIGLIIGPAIGGFFAQPAESFPSIFSAQSIFGRFPYLLPCLCISLFALGVLVVCIWIPETLHFHPEERTGDENVDTLEASYGSDMGVNNNENEGRISAPDNLLRNWPLISSILVYCVFSLQDTAYTEIFSLWTESDKKFGGLNFSTQDVGEILSVTGFGLLVFQLLIYPPAERRLGPVNLVRIAAVLNIALLSCYPLMAKLSGVILTVVINCASLVKNALSMIIITGTLLLQNDAVPQHQRGAANGLSMTMMSASRGVAPAAAGVIFSWAQKRQHASFLPGNYIVFFALNIVEFVGLLMTFKPFLVRAK